MFAGAATVIFLLVAFGVSSSHVNLTALGLALLSLEVLLSWGPISSRWPWGRRTP